MNTMEFYVSTLGNDNWSGRLAEPDAAGTDGPWATLGHARDALRALKQGGGLSGAVTVWVRGGRYALAAPLRFTPADSGPITYAAYAGEQPVIDGGQRIEGWQEVEIGGRRAWRVVLPEVAAGRWAFTQLFVNGERRPRARLPKSGYYAIEDVPGFTMAAGLFDGSDTFVAAPGDIQPWRNLTDVEVVVLHYWIEERMPIASFDPATRLVRSDRRSTFALKDDFQPRWAHYWLENVREALAEPGEWYLDRASGELLYLPKEGETPAGAEVYAPRLSCLLDLAGQPEQGQYVEYLRFVGLAWEHTEWQRPEGPLQRFDMTPMPAFVHELPLAAAPQAAADVPGALQLAGARYCAIEDGSVAHVAGYGVELGPGCHGNRVVGLELADLGAGGVRIDGANAQGPVTLRTGGNRVTDNTIHAGGRVYPSAVGILAMHTHGNTLSHNHIYDLFYSGISCGWVWGYTDCVAHDNHIERNDIHDIGQRFLSDMGGIYTLGVQPGTVVRGNLIHDVEKWNYGGWGVYLDEGSSHILVEDNLCYNTSSQGFHIHYGRENVIRNNIFAFGREGQFSLSRAEGHTALTFLRNLLVTDGQPLYTPGYNGAPEKQVIVSDLNLFWDVRGGEPLGSATAKGEQRKTLDDWRALGYDGHSLVADPRCKDLAGRDFDLAADSPALALGFRPWEYRKVGPRARADRD